MAKKGSKRRAWTPTHVRTLKTLARKKTHAARIAKALIEPKARRGRRRSVWEYHWTREPKICTRDKKGPTIVSAFSFL